PRRHGRSLNVHRLTLAVCLVALAVRAQGGASSQPQGAPPVQPPPEEAQRPAPPPPNALTLERAVQLALEANYDLRRAEYQAFSSAQDVVISRSNILPRLDFNASLSNTRIGGGVFQGTFTDPLTGGTIAQVSRDQVFRSYSARIAAQQRLCDGGKWWNTLAASNLALASSEANVQEQRLTAIYNVEQRFYELVRQQRQLRVLGDAAHRSRDQADFTQRLFEGGRVTQAAVYAARANRDNDEINRLGQEARVELARQDLALTVGAPPAEPLAIVEPGAMRQDPTTPPPAREAVDKALSQRPSLKAFALTVDSQQKAVGAAKGAYWPQVSLVASYGRSTSDIGTFTDSDLGQNSQLSGGVSLTWNIFGGLATKANVQTAEINVLLAVNDLENGRRTVASDVERAIAQLAVARQQARIAAQTQQNSSENLRLARTRQQVGVGTQLEVRDAELKLTQSELARANALV